jgi:hypothetical protein
VILPSTSSSANFRRCALLLNGISVGVNRATTDRRQRPLERLASGGIGS